MRNRTTQNGMTPLILAVSMGYLPMVHVLLEKGADKDLGDKVRPRSIPCSALDCASYHH